VTLAACAKDRSLEGRTLASLAQERCGSASVSDAAETVLAIAALDHPASSRTMCVYHSISEEDVRRIMSYPHTMIASDGWGDDRAMGSPHPRCYGTFPRVLGVYCRDVGLLPLETAVHKMTGQPAARLALPDRGVLRVGAVADLVVFDPVTVADKATFDNPKQYPAGIDYVVVNGVVTIARSEHMGALPGVFVPRPAGENGESGT
jgi:dihydroorotase/N-acyl-D-amino-acid deacylase